MQEQKINFSDNSNFPKSKPGEALFGIQRTYVKQLSSELLDAPEIFRVMDDWDPSIKLFIDVNNRTLPNQYSYEVVLDINISVVNKEDKPFFNCKVSFGSIFTIGGMEPHEVDNMLNIICPSIMFPYVREIVDSLLNRSSLPPLMLAPVNFEEYYRQKKAKADLQKDSSATNVSTEEVERLRAELAELKSKQKAQTTTSDTGDDKKSDNNKLKAELEALKAVRNKKKK